MAALFCVLAVAAPAAAHPHAWIDLVSRAAFDAQGRVTGIVEEWLFDPLYTAFITDGMAEDPAKRQAALDGLARTNLGNLAEYDYFTDVRAAGARLSVSRVEGFETRLFKDRLWMRFTVPLAEPADPRKGPLRYAIYDPSYWAEMLHAEGIAFELAPPAGQSCQATLTPPGPSEEQRRLAVSLDRDASAGDSLGVHFAEWVTLTCE